MWTRRRRSRKPPLSEETLNFLVYKTLNMEEGKWVYIRKLNREKRGGGYIRDGDDAVVVPEIPNK